MSILNKRTVLSVTLGVAAFATFGMLNSVSAQTLESALVLSYQNNPSLNAQRAALRAIDENVPIALSGYRPKITGTLTGGAINQDQISKVVSGTNGVSLPDTHKQR